jgi:hypothetical protein
VAILAPRAPRKGLGARSHLCDQQLQTRKSEGERDGVEISLPIETFQHDSSREKKGERRKKSGSQGLSR